MRSLAAGLAAALLLAATGTARAEGANNFFAGVTCLANAPLELPMHVYQPPDDFEDFPLAPVTGRMLGVVTGSLMTVHRVMMGTFDVVMTPVWVFPTMSPEGYFEIFEDVEYVE